MAETFQAVGVRAVALSGETPKEDRRVMLRQYTEGTIDLIANCMVLTEGTDLPRTGCILHCKPTKSATLFEQMTGRGLRLFDGKTKCIIIDVVDVARRHSLMTTPTLYGLPPSLTGKGQTLDQLADEWDELHEKYPQIEDLLNQRLTIEQLRVKASTFNIWDIPSLGALAQIVKLNWMKISEALYQLTYPWEDGKETIQVSPDLLGKWEVSCTIVPREGAKRQRTVAHGIADLPNAMTLAETHVNQERHNVVKLRDKSAPWRGVSASEKQLATLRKFRVPFNPKTLTRGQASDLLDLAFSRIKARGLR
jgi:ATP-dependent helicase IRC3